MRRRPRVNQSTQTFIYFSELPAQRCPLCWQADVATPGGAGPGEGGVQQATNKSPGPLAGQPGTGGDRPAAAPPVRDAAGCCLMDSALICSCPMLLVVSLLQ